MVATGGGGDGGEVGMGGGGNGVRWGRDEVGTQRGGWNH